MRSTRSAPTTSVSLRKVASDAGRQGSCRNFLADSDGAVATNIIRYANFSATDGRYLCAQFTWIPTLTCPKPNVTYTFESSRYWNTSAPANATAPTPGNSTFKVLHLSDWHLDPRQAKRFERLLTPAGYTVGSVSNCTNTGPCAFFDCG